MRAPCCCFWERRSPWDRGGAVFIPSVAVLVARLRDEEQFLLRNLDGYGDYCSRVRFRLVPRLW